MMQRPVASRRSILSGPALALAALVVGFSAAPSLAGGKMAWLDEVVQTAIREAEAGGKIAARDADGVSARTASRLLTREADDSLEALARRSDDLARAAGKLDEPADAALKGRFARVVGADDPSLIRVFDELSPAERRLAVEMGETAQDLARRYPGQAEPLIRSLGVDGMSAVRVYGDDVAEVIAKEGPESIGILRKTGRGGWDFFTGKVLPNKKKLAAAGVLALFLANPDRFVDEAGKFTQYAVEQFAKAGIDLAGAMGQGAQTGLETAIGAKLAAYGLDSYVLRKLGMLGAAAIALFATMVILGLPIGWLLRPVTWPLKLARTALRRAA